MENKNFTADQMIKTIALHSRNELSKAVCLRILSKESTIPDELEKNHGSFISNVLNGNYERAWVYGDIQNRAALAKLLEGSEEWQEEVPEDTLW